MPSITALRNMSDWEREYRRLTSELQFLQQLELKLRARAREPGADQDYIAAKIIENQGRQEAIRDALRALTVIPEDNRGTYVSRTTPEDVSDIEDAVRKLSAFNVQSRAAAELIAHALDVLGPPR